MVSPHQSPPTSPPSWRKHKRQHSGGNVDRQPVVSTAAVAWTQFRETQTGNALPGRKNKILKKFCLFNYLYLSPLQDQCLVMACGRPTRHLLPVRSVGSVSQQTRHRPVRCPQCIPHQSRCRNNIYGFFFILLICSNSCIRTKSNVKAKEKWTCSAHVALKCVTTWWRNLILLTFSIFNIPYRYSTALYQPVKYSWRWFSLFCFHFFSSDSKCSSLCSSVRWNRVWD